MDTRKLGATPEMQVTSIRLESQLKERLREIAGRQGYQALIRDVLWQFVRQQSESTGERSPLFPSPQSRLFARSEVRAVVEAIAQQEEQCAITGQPIHPHQKMWLGLTTTGTLIPIANPR